MQMSDMSVENENGQKGSAETGLKKTLTTEEAGTLRLLHTYLSGQDAGLAVCPGLCRGG
jgi:hypothetical protein